MIREPSAQWKTWAIVAVSVFVGLVGIATLVGMPWRYTAGGVVGIAVQILGSLGAVGIGVALAWLSVTSARKK